MPLSHIIPKIMAVITRHPRNIVEMERVDWSKSVVHPFFNAFEAIFGRRAGIRHEMSAWVENGITKYKATSWEAKCALVEMRIRSLIKKLSYVRVYVPIIVTPQGIPFFASPYLFAIAIDSQAATTGAGSVTTLSFTCTGSNRMLFAYFIASTQGSDPNATGNYGGTGMNKIDTVRYPADRWTQDFLLKAPTTTASTTFTAGSLGTPTYAQIVLSSYTGVNQADTSGTIDSHNTSSANGTPWLISTPVVAANCWVVSGNYGIDPFAVAVTPGTIRTSNSASDLMLGDSNGTVSTGSYTQSWTINTPARVAVGCIVSLAPVASAVNSNFLMFM